jgi:hypothetical protein
MYTDNEINEMMMKLDGKCSRQFQYLIRLMIGRKLNLEDIFNIVDSMNIYYLVIRPIENDSHLAIKNIPVLNPPKGSILKMKEDVEDDDDDDGNEMCIFVDSKDNEGLFERDRLKVIEGDESLGAVVCMPKLVMAEEDVELVFSYLDNKRKDYGIDYIARRLKTFFFFCLFV